MKHKNFDREFAFLLYIIGAENKNKIDPSKIDSSLLIQLVHDHRILSNVYRNLYKIDDSGLKQKVEALYLENKISQLKLIEALVQLKSLFEPIEFLVLKGPVLSQLLYNDPAERTSRDLDILVDLNDIDKCSEILVNAGFKLLTIHSTPKQREAIIKHYHHLEFYNSTSGINVELHWNVTSLKTQSITISDLTDKTIKVNLGEHAFKTLTKKDQLGYLSMHGTFHLFYRMQWLMDVQSLLHTFNSEELDETMNSIQNEGTYNFVLVAMGVMKNLLGTPIEEKYNALIQQDSRVTRLITLSEEAIRTNCSYGLDLRSETNFKDMITIHKVQYLTGGFNGLFKSIVSRNIRPKNWEYFAFSDRVFFLNHLFSRVIWLLSKIRKNK